MGRSPKDFLDELIAERAKRNPRFLDLVEEASARRRLAQRLTKDRERQGLSQTVVAAAMGTAQSVVSKLEAGADVKVSTLQRYCHAIGQDLVQSLSARRQPKTTAAKSVRARRGATKHTRVPRPR